MYTLLFSCSFYWHETWWFYFDKRKDECNNIESYYFASSPIFRHTVQCFFVRGLMRQFACAVVTSEIGVLCVVVVVVTQQNEAKETHLHIHPFGSLPFPCRDILHDPCSLPFLSSLVALRKRQTFQSSVSAPLAMRCGYPENQTWKSLWYLKCYWTDRSLILRTGSQNFIVWTELLDNIFFNWLMK